ncbi:MAG: glycosyltransferase family 2 protein [Raineya sp.]
MLSIIIINYNTFSLTCKCIESIIRHTEGIDYEIILVDNASSECSADKFLELFPQITLIKSPENVGFAKGNNLGLQYAKGEYILLLNSDIELLENSIYQAIEHCKKNPNIGVLSTALIYPNGTLQPVANRFPSIYLEIIELLRIQKFLPRMWREKILLGFFFSQDRTIEADWVWGAFFLTKKSIIELFPEKKLFDSFFMYYEDVQWCHYIKKKLRYKIIYFPETKVLHHGSASSPNSEEKKVAKLEQNLNNEKVFLQAAYGKCYLKILYWLRFLKFKSLRQEKFKQIADLYKKMLKEI